MRHPRLRRCEFSCKTCSKSQPTSFLIYGGTPCLLFAFHAGEGPPHALPRYPASVILLITYGWRAETADTPAVKEVFDLMERFLVSSNPGQNAVDLLPILDPCLISSRLGERTHTISSVTIRSFICDSFRTSSKAG
jgi:hypothetical protein